MRDDRYHDGFNHAGHLLGWLIPLVIIAGLVMLTVWAVRRLTSLPASAVPTPTPAPGTPQNDPAVESARMRYARGELSREEFLRVAEDLGAPVLDRPGPPASS
jgi:uncharacterized membrane protein